jgi:hypothetical protein
MPLDLDPIKARLKAAPGPLSHDRSGRLYGPDRRPGCIVTRSGWGYGATRDYRALLTHSAEDIKALVEEVEQLRAALVAWYDADGTPGFSGAEAALEALARRVKEAAP